MSTQPPPSETAQSRYVVQIAFPGVPPFPGGPCYSKEHEEELVRLRQELAVKKAVSTSTLAPPEALTLQSQLTSILACFDPTHGAEIGRLREELARKTGELDALRSVTVAKVAGLEGIVEGQRATIAAQQGEIGQLKARIAELQLGMADLNKIVFRVTVREAMRHLEQHIAIGVVGSKRAARSKQYSIALLAAAGRKEDVDRRLSQQAQDMLEFLKDIGDRQIHERSLTTWEHLEAALLHTDDDDAERAAKAELLRVFRAHVASSGIPFGQSPL